MYWINQVLRTCGTIIGSHRGANSNKTYIVAPVRTAQSLNQGFEITA